MSQFIGTSMARGFAGMLTRGSFDNTTEILPNDGTAPVTAFGVAVKLNTGKTGVTPCTDDADAVYGISVREYGQANDSGVQAMPMVTILKRGYIAVAPTAGTPARGGVVYIAPDGSITADSTGAGTLSGAYWMGAEDSDGLAELAFNI